ncbi:MAG TPA: bifunctional diaminohydroxyphosphoribosylaminopyrimidine deaminase/5-amino-6-(5-phosphoribosylamino)uracil reductase RibD, partial [Kiritimatiellia bacterium]|nr:bifunctional diaminohydroxyphosphoribosylaminopyrimidine deaminase/5-amino-6-(5-phosphoribosylamino)uracil reductase RibD [Kiritimatiellia bacterium]
MERLSKDQRWMMRALALARRAEGLTRPNPPVGAVVVRGGRMVGEGYHRKAGGPHAEIIAMHRAGALARGATLYVTLEPCCTWGRTPPCTDAVIASGVRRVVVGARDPNARHAGRGLRRLRRAGI